MLRFIYPEFPCWPRNRIIIRPSHLLAILRDAFSSEHSETLSCQPTVDGLSRQVTYNGSTLFTTCFTAFDFLPAKFESGGTILCGLASDAIYDAATLGELTAAFQECENRDAEKGQPVILVTDYCVTCTQVRPK